MAAVGAGVTHVTPGDLVINLQRENWAQKRHVKGEDVIRLPADIDLRQAAMVRINPPTAQLMLSDFVDLKGGDWVIQNVANSAVGRLLIVLAHQRGLRTVNVVRRAELADELKQLGADLVILDVKMPILDGISAAERIVSERVAPCLILTAFSQRDLVERARDAGAMAYLVEPFTKSDLVPAIEMAVSRHEEIAMLEREVATLSERLETRKLVERAKGLLMAQHGWTAPQAFRSGLSRRRRRPAGSKGRAGASARMAAASGLM